MKGKGGPVAILALHQVAHLVMDADHVAALQSYAANAHYREKLQHNGKISKFHVLLKKEVV